MRAHLRLPFVVAVALLFLSTAQAGIISNGLIGYWAADGNVTDSSPTANNGTFLGTYAAGHSGQAFDLSATTVSVPDNAAYNFGTGDFSVGFWFNYNGLSQGIPAFVSQDNGGGPNDKWIVFYNYASSAFSLHVNGSVNGNYASTTQSFSSSDWQQLTLTKTGTAYEFFLNGISIGTTIGNVTLPNPTSPLTFGGAEGNFRFTGLLDDVVLYDRALTSSEVGVLAEPATVPEPSGFWLLGGGTILALWRHRKVRA